MAARKARKGKPLPRRESIREPAAPKTERLLDMVNRFVDSLCESAGMERVHSEFLREQGGRVLRLYIDKPGGVSLDDCAWVSRQVGDFLDVGLEEVGPYHLEVSSPGPERPIGKVSDYGRFQGRRARITLSEPLEGRKNFTGVLTGLSEEAVSLKIGQEVISLPLERIRKARLVDGEN